MQPRTVVDNFSIEQIVPFFQPIYDLNSHKVVRYECLARLVTKDDNVFLPCEFLNIIKRSQSSAQITRRILELSGAYCAPRDMRWSINMFQTDLRDTNLISWMQSQYRSFDNNSLCGHLHPFFAGVEISFDDVKHQAHLLTNLMQKLPKLHVTIDDVYEIDSTLIEILETGIHAIKLRGDIVTAYSNMGENKLLIKQMITLCIKQKCDLVAEHIEDDKALDAVMKMGLTMGQGYFLSKPKGRMTNLIQV